MKTISNNLLKVIMLMLLTVSISCEKEENCAYTELMDCQVLGLNIGDDCDSNGDGELDGTVNEDCECDGFPYSCSEGMEVAFLIDYTGSMGGAIDGIKSNVSAIVSAIDGLSLSNYKLSLSIFDEVEKTANPIYFSQTDYSSLPASQKKVITSGPGTDQYLTVMEKFSSNNSVSFGTQLAKLNNSMSLGSGLGFPEPGGLLFNEIFPTNNFAGNWDPSNITKIAIIITDALAGGDDDTANGADDSYLANLANIANSEGIQCLLVTSLPSSNYEELIDNNIGGLKLLNADFNNISTDIINLLEELCENNED